MKSSNDSDIYNLPHYKCCFEINLAGVGMIKSQVCNNKQFRNSFSL